MIGYLKLKIFNPVEDEINFDSFIKFPLLLFRVAFINFNPLHERANLKEKISYYARRSYNKFMIVCCVWTIISKVILVVNSADITDASPLLLDVASYILNEFKILTMILFQDEIWELFQDLKPLFDRQSNENKKYGVKKYLDSYHRLAIVYTIPIVVLLTGIVFPIIPFILYGTMELPLPYWYPFDPFQAKYYLIAYFWSNWAAFTVLMTLLATDILLYAMITVIAMEFDILKMDLMRIGGTPRNKEFIQTLVDKHNKLLNLSERLERIYSLSFLFSFVISSFVMCFLSYQLSTNFDNFALFAFYFFYLWMMGVQILLLCVFGQKLINSSESISEGVYNSGWEGISDDEAYKKQLVMIISRAQRPKRLTAMGFADISVETFTTVSLLVGVRISVFIY